MTTFALAATAEPSNSPPRVKLVATTSGSPTVTAVTVVRTDTDGDVVPVRTLDGGPLVLTLSGSSYTGTVYDYEIPYGQAASYSLVESSSTTAGPVTISTTQVWLTHPGVPDRSMAVDFRVGSFAESTRSVNAGVFYPLGRRNAVVISDGQRNGRQSSFIIATDTLADLAKVDALIDDAGVLFLNVPPALGFGIDSCYVFIQDTRERRPSNIGSAPQRDMECPYVVVDRPIGGTQAQYTWADVVTTYSSWQTLLSKNSTWAKVQAPTS